MSPARELPGRTAAQHARRLRRLLAGFSPGDLALVLKYAGYRFGADDRDTLARALRAGPAGLRAYARDAARDPVARAAALALAALLEQAGPRAAALAALAARRLRQLGPRPLARRRPSPARAPRLLLAASILDRAPPRLASVRASGPP